MSQEPEGGEFSEVVHTPEDQAAFDERVGVLRGMLSLTNDQFTAELEEDREERNLPLTPETPISVLDELEERRVKRRQRLIWLGGLLMGIIIALIVILALWGQQDRDLARDITGGSSDVDEIAPPEPAATPAEVLPPEVFTHTCADCGDTEVTQVALDLNKDAKYQFAYEAGGSRIAILSVVDSADYDATVQELDAAYASALEEGRDVPAPKMLEGVGDGAVVFDSTAVFKSGEDMGVLWANTLQDAGGEQSVTITVDELERLARIAAPRM
ncbi:MAG: hypothetical protein JW733_00560 [Coriobacteriia bacterium]|nr:hypothetical protein [Coriobacteriia bacterium]MBN2840199.1 hypothetical protein [Coriobacteriia bacterium]